MSKRPNLSYSFGNEHGPSRLKIDRKLAELWPFSWSRFHYEIPEAARHIFTQNTRVTAYSSCFYSNSLGNSHKRGLLWVIDPIGHFRNHHFFIKTYRVTAHSSCFYINSPKRGLLWEVDSIGYFQNHPGTSREPDIFISSSKHSLTAHFHVFHE